MNMRTPPSLLNDEDEPNIIMNMAPPDVDFSEYEWMAEDLDEFDRQVSVVFSFHSLLFVRVVKCK